MISPFETWIQMKNFFMTTMNSQISYVVRRYPNVGYEIANLLVSTFLQQRTVSRLSYTTLQMKIQPSLMSEEICYLLYEQLKSYPQLLTAYYVDVSLLKVASSQKITIVCCSRVERYIVRYITFQLQNVLNVCPGEITGYARSDLLLLRTTFQHKSVNIVIENKQ